QISSCPGPAKRECAEPPYFHLSQFPASLFTNAGALGLRRSCDAPRRSARINNREPKGSCRQHFCTGKVNLVTSKQPFCNNKPNKMTEVSRGRSLCRWVAKMRLVRRVRS